MKISIITITWNAEKFIERTVRSVVDQDFCDIEYILIDGGSTDETLKVVDRYPGLFAHVVSEADKGISDAWNKGLALATGDVVSLLNAGDEYCQGTLTSVASMFAGDAHVGVIYGDTVLVGSAGEVVAMNRGRFHPWLYSGGPGFYHPSLFARRRVYSKVGGFGLGFKYAMDADWIFRVLKAGERLVYSPHKVRMLDDGISVQARFKAYGEYLQCLAAEGNPKSWPYLSMLSTAARGLAKTLVGRGRG